MKSVSVSFKNRNQTLTAEFDVYAFNELTRSERSAIIAQWGGKNITILGNEEWEDEDSPARIEKQAAILAGLENRVAFLVRKSLK